MKKTIGILLILLAFGFLFGCPGTLPVCGNSVCETGELPLTCPVDCEQIDYCGDGICNEISEPYSCPQDCGIIEAQKLIIETTNFIENGEIDIIHLPSNQDPVKLNFYLENSISKENVSFEEIEFELRTPVEHNPTPIMNPENQIEILSDGSIRAIRNSFIYLKARLKSDPTKETEEFLVIVGEPEETESGDVLVLLPRNYYPEGPDNQCEIDMNCFPGNKIYNRFGEIDYFEVCNENECIYETGKYCRTHNDTFCNYKEQGRYPISFMLENYKYTEMVNLFYDIESDLYNGLDPYPNSKQVLAVLEIPDLCGGNNNPLETSGGCYINTNDGSPQYSTVIHEIGHNFADNSKGMSQLLRANNETFNQLGFGECVASMPVQYIRAKLRDNPKEYGISFDSYESNTFGAWQTIDDQDNKKRLELIEQRITDDTISGIHEINKLSSQDLQILGGDVGAICSLFVTPAAYPNEFDNNYGWEFYERFLTLFENEELVQFEETKVETYFAAAYSVAIGKNMKDKLIFWGFEIDENYFEEIYNLLNNKIDYCGDESCNNNESYETCPQDCSSLPTADTSDLELFNVNVYISNALGTPIENAKIRLYNEDSKVYFPIKTNLEEYHGINCERARQDDYHFVETNSSGIAKAKINKGNYIISIRKSIYDANSIQKTIFIDQQIYLDSETKEISIQVEKEIDVSFQNIGSGNIENYELYATNSNLKPGFPAFNFGFVNSNLMIQTSNESKISFLLKKNPSENNPGYLLMKDLDASNELEQVIFSNDSLSELNFNVLGPDQNPSDIGYVHINPVDFQTKNITMNFRVNEQEKLFASPQNINLRYHIDSNGWQFSLLPANGSIISLYENDSRQFNLGGPFDLKLKVASFNPPRRAYSNYFWFLVKDSFGNVMQGYVTKNESLPQIVVKQGENIVFDYPIEGQHPNVHNDQRNYYYFENLDDYTITFNETFGEFGSINLENTPLSNIEMNLMEFESENIEFIIPSELSFLESDWTNNFQLFYEKMSDFYGIEVTEKIPVRVVVDGADRSWAPIIWPTVAYEHDTKNYNSWFMITHELGHPFTSNPPLNNALPYNEESKASFIGISAAKMTNENVGNYIQASYPINYKYLEDQSICYDEIEIIQNLMLYLNARYPDKKPTINLMKKWETEYADIYNSLRSQGCGFDESYGAMYSIELNENVGPIFEKFGLTTSQEITDCINK